MLLVLGNQLFAPEHLEPHRDAIVYLAEDHGLCTYVRHHQQKIVLFLAAMRGYRDELLAAGFDVFYDHLQSPDDDDYETRLDERVVAEGVRELRHFEIEDRAMERRIHEYAERRGLKRVELPSPMFLCSREQFSDYLDQSSRPFMADFYRRERKRLGLLVNTDGKPDGGRWSFDEDNRKKLPRSVTPPDVEPGDMSPQLREVIDLVEDRFADHPGVASEFWWPVTREGARRWLDEFLDERFADFGPYEDAISKRSSTVFHSLLSPLINIGLLTPREVLDAGLSRVRAKEIPLQSTEGFIRQVIGWREFIRGIYRHYDDSQSSANHWSHERRLSSAWYDGSTGIPPLDDTIRDAQALGWTHHITRLMVAANLMTLAEIHPQEVWRWFMEMYVDSSEWVMGPNVYGMGTFSDGGVFATKPYICGSNYLRKMSDYPAGDWCDTVDGLYWRFIDKHRDFFAGQPRLALMPRALERLTEDRRTRIFSAAEHFLETHTS